MGNTLEFRKNNLYYDKKGVQLIVGDLLKVFHFRSRNRNYYMYQVVVMEETLDFPVLAFRDYDAIKPHYRAYVVCNEQRIINICEIIYKKDWEEKRSKIKVKQD